MVLGHERVLLNSLRTAVASIKPTEEMEVLKSHFHQAQKVSGLQCGPKIRLASSSEESLLRSTGHSILSMMLTRISPRLFKIEQVFNSPLQVIRT